MAKQVLTVILGHADLVKQRGHLAKGALFLPEPEPLPEPFAEIVLRVENASGEGVEMDARVLQILEGRGIAVAFDDAAGAKKKLTPLFDSAVSGEEDEPTFIFWGRGAPVSRRDPSVPPKSGKTPSKRPSKRPSKKPSPGASFDIDPDLDFFTNATTAGATEPPPGMDVHTIPKIPVAARAPRTDPPAPAPDTLPKIPLARPPTPRIVKMTPAVAFAPPKLPAQAPQEVMDTQVDPPKPDLELNETAKLEAELATMSVNQKMQLAMKGDRAARALLLKDPNKNIQSFIIQNPRITLDEVKYLAGFRQANADVLNAIAAHRDWTQNPGVVAALVRNPKTPGPTAVRMMEKLPMTEIRRLAKANDSPPAVMAAARKKIADPGARG